MTSCTEQVSVAMAPIIPDIDLQTRDALQAKIEKTEVQWTLHPELRVPHCKDLVNCRTCTRYIDYVEAVREGKDGVSGTALKRRPRPIPTPIILEPPRSKPHIMLPTPRTLGTHTSEIDLHIRCTLETKVQVEGGPMKLYLDLNVPWCDGCDICTHYIDHVEAVQEGKDNEEQEDNGKSIIIGLEIEKEAAQKARDEASARMKKLEQANDELKARCQEERDLKCSALEEVEELRKLLEVADQQWSRKQAKGASSTCEQAPAAVKAISQQTPTSDVHMAAVEDLDPRDAKLPPHGPIHRRTARVSEAELREQFSLMRQPTAHDPLELYARWLQFNEFTNIKGIPICGPHWIVDLRDVQGYHQVTSRTPHKGRKTQCLQYGKSLFAMLRVLAMTGMYKSILESTNMQVAVEVKLLPCDFGDQPLNDVDVTRLLAARGMTVAIADDSWQWCYKFLQAQVVECDDYFVEDEIVGLVARVNAAVVNGPLPEGLNPANQDQFATSIRLTAPPDPSCPVPLPFQYPAPLPYYQNGPYPQQFGPTTDFRAFGSYFPSG
ncbi:hypothetical protein B0H10DRAFT_1964119 [Mycena sp. CBHHK59/15]|nr:hypothetical protein B0H10DRAFT_1964119 [Mycena sp. CBHHK59/15]